MELIALFSCYGLDYMFCVDLLLGAGQSNDNTSPLPSGNGSMLKAPGARDTSSPSDCSSECSSQPGGSNGPPTPPATPNQHEGGMGPSGIKCMYDRKRGYMLGKW